MLSSNTGSTDLRLDAGPAAEDDRDLVLRIRAAWPSRRTAASSTPDRRPPASSFLPSTPPLALISSIVIRATSLSTVSEIAIVPESECRMPTLMVSAAKRGQARRGPRQPGRQQAALSAKRRFMGRRPPEFRGWRVIGTANMRSSRSLVCKACAIAERRARPASAHHTKAVSAPTWPARGRARPSERRTRQSGNARRVSRVGCHQTSSSRSKVVDREQPPAAARAADAPAALRRVAGAVDRADDEFAPAVEKLAGLPVELGRHVHAAVQVGDDAAVEAQRERARRLAEVEHVEDDRAAFLEQLDAGAEALRRQRRDGSERGGGDAPSSGMRGEPARRGRRSNGRRAAADGSRTRRGSCAPKLTATLAQPALAASCRSCVVSPTISVRSVAAPSSRISSTQHQRIGLAARLVGGAGRVEQAGERRAGERLVEAAPRLAGGDARASGCAPSARAASRACRRRGRSRPGSTGSGGDSARRARRSARAATSGAAWRKASARPRPIT